jgi:3D (Asp-Asp-Asp) domain-containing protein
MHVVSGNVYAEKAIAEPVPIAEPAPVVVAEPESVATTETYEATWYTPYCEGCSGITFAGHNAKKSIYTSDGLRVIATDPTVVPMYSIVTVTLADGTTFKAQALDTGGAIRGNRIDILVASRAEAMTLGRQAVEIEVIRRGSD